MRAVQDEPGQKLEELAAQAEIHINTARDHLRVLEEEGLVASRPLATGTRGRPPAGFYPVCGPGMNPSADERVMASLSRGDMLRRLYPSLDRSSVIGEEAQHQIDTLVAHLEDVGLEPDLDLDRLEVTVVPCPEYDLCDENRASICDVHERLIRDQLSQVSGPLEVEQLEPFVTPDECRLTLSMRKQRLPNPAMPPRKQQR
ncbi:helix-turn-helix domain-containing protein [Leucobacter denitrificans]|nr:hypothetical protein [Leucobacter denitrificans]